MFPKSAKAPLALLAFLVLGCAKTQERLLGTEPTAAPQGTVATLKSATTPVVLTGTIADKCPTAGCWFHLKDHSGIVKVSVASAGFTVTDIPTGAPVRVFGTFDKETNQVEATGLRW